MVLVQSAPQSLLSRVHPNPARILGIAGAVSLNVAVLMALMLPADLPMPKLMQDIVINPTIVEIPEKPERVPVVSQQPEEKPRPTLDRSVAQQVPQPPVVTPDAGPMDQPLPPQQMDATFESSTPDPGPVIDTAPIAGVRLQYAHATPPPYPADAMRHGTQGTVLLQVLVDVDGKPLEVAIHRSSGNRELDRVAQRHVMKIWTFQPAMKDGQAIQAIGIVPIEFKLQ